MDSDTSFSLKLLMPILYLIGIAAAGCVCAIRAWRKDGKLPLESPNWNNSILNAVIFLWVATILPVAGQMLAPFLFELPADADMPSDGQLYYALGVQTLTLLWILVCIYRYPAFVGGGLQKARPFSYDLKSGFYRLLSAIPLIWTCSLGWTLILQSMHSNGWIENPPSPQMVIGIFNNSDSLALQATLGIFAVIIGPATEEFVFRGVLYRALKRILPVWAAMLLSALLFAAIHWDLSSFAPLAVIGIVLCRVYERTGSIRSAIILHGLFNLNTLLLLILFSDAQQLLETAQ